jgi:hypothetical protein
MLPQFPWFVLLGPDCSRPVSEQVPGMGEVILVFTTESAIRRYRKEHAVAGPAIQFTTPQQFVDYLRVWASISAVAIHGEGSELNYMPAQRAAQDLASGRKSHARGASSALRRVSV